MKLLFVAALWALCAVTAAAAAPGGVRTISAADVDALLHDVAELKGTISALNAELADELRLAREHAAAEAARAAAAAAPEAHTHHTLPVDTPARRRLQASAPEIAISHPDGSVQFHRGTALMDANTTQPALHAGGRLEVRDNAYVGGGLRVDGAAANLGVPMLAEEDVMRGDALSMVPSGGVAKGFGLSLTSPVASAGSTEGNMVTVAHSSTSLSIVYTDSDGYLYSVYHDATLSSVDPPALVTPFPVYDFTATAVSATQVVVCYGRVDTQRGYCRAGELATAWSYGDAVEVNSDGEYHGGAVTALRDTTERVVLAFSMTETPGQSNTEQFNALLLFVSGDTVSAGGNLPWNIVPSRVDFIAITALTQYRMLVCFRPLLERSTRVQELYFDVDNNDLLTIKKRLANDLSQSGATEFTHAALDRMSDDRVVLAFRNPQSSNAVMASVVDVSQNLPSIGPFATVHSGSPASGIDADSSLLALGVAVSDTNRVVFSYLDADFRPSVVDAAAFGASIVVGRPQVVAADEAQALGIAAAAATSMQAQAWTVFQPQHQDAAATRAHVVTTTTRAGPTLLGFAKSHAAAGSQVVVVVQGSLDAFADLVPGAPYYARFDGGVAQAPSRAGGVSDTVVGRALTPTMLLSRIGADGKEAQTSIAALGTELSQLLADTTDLKACVQPTWDGLKNTDLVRKDLAVFRWAFWSTYVNSQGWVMNNERQTFGDVHPSWWSSNYRAKDISNDKKFWPRLFTNVIHADANAIVQVDEWRYVSSSDSRHIGVLMRIRNTTPNDISWTMFFKHSSYNGWGETAGASLNGDEVWQQGGNCADCDAEVTMTMRADFLNTVIVTTGAGSESSGARTSLLVFTNDCLRLPEGLEWVNDLGWNSEGMAEYVV